MSILGLWGNVESGRDPSIRSRTGHAEAVAVCNRIDVLVVTSEQVANGHALGG